MGSKRRIASDILDVMMHYYKDDNPKFVDVFCGGCNLLEHVPANWKRIANDNNIFLIHMWFAITNNVVADLPKRIEKDLYSDVRRAWHKGDVSMYPIYLQGWVGFMASYNGRFFDGGYSGHNANGRDYIEEQINNTLKQVDKLRNVVWCAGDYSELSPLPKHSLIYCDPPYNGTKEYSTSVGFDYDKFYDWCRVKKQEGHEIFVSEYNMPSDFDCVWEKQVTNAMNQHKTYKPIERLFKL